MSESYALRHELSFVELSTPMIIQTPGSRWQTNRVSHGNHVAIEGLVFLASLIALKSSDIDVILRMDWLSRQNAFLDCKAKSVRLTHPSGKTINYTSPRTRTQVQSLNVLHFLTLKIFRWFVTSRMSFLKNCRVCHPTDV